MCLVERVRMLDEHPSGMSYSAVGCEFDVNESIIYVKKGDLKQKHT